MAVAVIGGAGFIGSNLVDELLTQGFEVDVLDNMSEGKYENLMRWKGNPKLQVIKGDIRDYETVRRVVDHKTWVFHLAAMSRIQPSIKDPLESFSINIMGTANVLEASRQAGVKRVIYSASSSAYGRRNADAIIPLAGLIEELPHDCNSPYSFSKFTGEELMDFYHQMYGMSTVSLRYFNVYGPRHQETGSYATVVAIFRKQVRDGRPMTPVGDGTQRRDFTFVSDVVRANMMAAMNYDARGVFNIGTGKNYSINEVADLIGGKDYPREFLPPREGEYPITLANVEKAKRVLGWNPSIGFREGLAVLDKFEQIQTSRLIIVGR
jgi:UDP-glucose 4-epimerase